MDTAAVRRGKDELKHNHVTWNYAAVPVARRVVLADCRRAVVCFGSTSLAKRHGDAPARSLPTWIAAPLTCVLVRNWPTATAGAARTPRRSLPSPHIPLRACDGCRQLQRMAAASWGKLGHLWGRTTGHISRTPFRRGQGIYRGKPRVKLRAFLSGDRLTNTLLCLSCGLGCKMRGGRIPLF